LTATSSTGAPQEVPFGLQILASEHGTTSTIELRGEWDIAQRQPTRDAVNAALQRRPECLVIDLTQVSFIDSTGISVIVNTSERCAGQSTRLVIIPGPRAVQRVFELCGLTKILPFAEHP
jgi:anti-sigma B factor antagonist